MAVDLTPYRVNLGDTTELIDKLNGLQTELETYSAELDAIKLAAAGSAIAAAASEQAVQDLVTSGIPEWFLDSAKYPSLVLDFATGNGKTEKPCVARYQSNAIQDRVGFDNIVTVIRASSGSYYDADGRRQTAAVDEPRFFYDPVTGEQKGLMREEKKTNLAWPFKIPAVTTGTMGIGSSVTVVPDAVLGRDGITLVNGYQGLAGSTNTSSGASVRCLLGAQPAGTYTYAIDVMGSVGGTNISCRFLDGGAGLDTIVSFQTENGQPAQTSTEWNRFYATVTLGAGSTNFTIIPNVSSNDETIYLDAVQAELGSFPSSPIKTTVAPATREADIVTVNTLAPWCNLAAGTLVTELEYMGKGNQFAYPISLSDGSINNAIAQGWAVTSSLRSYISAAGVANFATATSGRIVAGTPHRLALTYDAASAQDASDGTVAATSAAAFVLPVAIDRLEIGMLAGSISFGSSVYIRSITYYPHKMTETEIEAVTA